MALHSDNTTQQKVRVGGSGFTVFTWQSTPIAFCRQVAHTSPAPVGSGAVAVHPMDEPYPIQVITPAAAGMGTLTLELYEVYGHKIWERLRLDGGIELGGATPANDIVDIFIRVASSSRAINVVKIIRPPKLRGTQQKPQWEIYHGCVITNVLDGETIEVGTMEVLKQITVAYRYMTRSGGRRNDAFALRDGQLPGVSTGAEDRG